MSEVESGAPDYEGGGLSRETNWWGAFVIGLAGTILVTGIAPVMVTSLGAASIPIIVLITISGYLLCLLLAELSAMMPERTGGSPSYAYPAYKDRWPRFARHVNGFTAWAYWLGWFPVAPLNMILASFYIADKFNLNTTSGITPIHTFIAYWTIAIAIGGILLVFIPAWLGIRLGAMFATVLGLLSMIPLTFLAIAPIFKPSVTDWGNLSNPSWFSQIDGTPFFSNLYGHGWLTVYIAFAFLLTWNVIAMEAAACYIGECRDPERDAKIAMNLEGLYGLFIYTMIPLSFVIVFGAHLADPALVDPKTMFTNFASAVFGSNAGWLDWLISIMLIVALMLSVLNSIMGCARGTAPDVDRRAVPADLLQREPARRARLLDGIQRGLLDRSGVHRRRGRDLHPVQRRLHRVVHPGAGRLLPAAQVPRRHETTGAATELHEIHGPVPRGGVLRDLVVWRSGRSVIAERPAGRQRHQDLLLHRLGDPHLLPAHLLVAGEGGGSEARARGREALRRSRQATDRTG